MSVLSLSYYDSNVTIIKKYSELAPHHGEETAGIDNYGEITSPYVLTEISPFADRF